MAAPLRVFVTTISGASMVSILVSLCRLLGYCWYCLVSKSDLLKLAQTSFGLFRRRSRSTTCRCGSESSRLDNQLLRPHPVLFLSKRRRVTSTILSCRFSITQRFSQVAYPTQFCLSKSTDTVLVKGDSRTIESGLKSEIIVVHSENIPIIGDFKASNYEWMMIEFVFVKRATFIIALS